ncbi:MAG: hypothetical protein EHM33_07810 [Chloroflexi bacterium]|nr:MAG: hypothetical protein EHM33_07810 [Chloroflexota bacterium]
MKSLLLHDRLIVRFLALLALVTALFLLTWTASYWFLPEGLLRGRTGAAALAGETAASSFLVEWLRILAINFSICLLVVIAPNLLRAGLPMGYYTASVQAIVYAVILGTNSFTFPLPEGPLPPTLAVLARSGPYEIAAYLLAATATASLARWTLHGRWPRQTLQPWEPSRGHRVSRVEWAGLVVAGMILLSANAWEAWQIITHFG